MSQSADPATSGGLTSGGPDGQRTVAARWARARLPFLLLAMVLTAAGLLSAWFPLRPPRAPAGAALWQANFWLAPTARNEFARLPFLNMRIAALAVLGDGKTVVAAGSGGTLLHSVDGGAVWGSVTSGTQSSLFSLAVLGDGKTALAAGEDGTLVRSIDGGAAWGRVTSGTQFKLESLAVLGDGKTVVAAGDGGTLLRSVDGGASWGSVTSGTKASLLCLAVLGDGKTVLAAGSDGTLLRSVDGGAAWGRVTSGTQGSLLSLAVLTDGTTVLAAGSGGTLLRSVDGGVTWGSVTSGTQALLLSLAVLGNGKTVLAAGDGGTLLRSIDGGVAWGRVTSGTQAWFRSLAVLGDGKTVLAAGDGGTLARSVDGGATWESVTSGTQAFLLSLAVLGDGKTVLAAGSGGTLVRSVDGGVAWGRVTSGTQAFLLSLAVLGDGKTVLAAGYGGTLVRSVDGGATWGSVTSGTQAVLLSLAVLGDGKTVLAAGSDGTLLRSVDGGAAWGRVTSGTQAGLLSLAVLGDGKTVLAAGDGGTLVRSVDGGATWGSVTSGTQAGLRSLAVLGDGKTVLAAGLGGTLVRSVDGGATWGSVTSGTQAGLRSLAVLGDGKTVLAAGDGGTLVRSVDGGATWGSVTSGTQAGLRSLAVLGDGKTVLAAGLGGTLVRSVDGGATWTRVAYTRSPPIIAWLLLAAGFLAAVPGTRRVTLPDPPPGIAERLANDGPLSSGQEDTSRTGLMARRVSRFLRNAGTTPPFTIAITGEWGSGKSSMMNLLCQDLAESGRRPVWFNAWHHQKEEHIFAALLQAVRRDAVPKAWSSTGILIRLRLLGQYIIKHPLRCTVIAMVLTASVGWCWRTWPAPLVQSQDGFAWGWHHASAFLTKPSPSPPATSPGTAASSGAATAPGDTPAEGSAGALLVAIVAALKAVTELAKGLSDRLKASKLDPGRLMASRAGDATPKDMGAQLDFRARFQEALHEVTEALGERFLTVLIDDLDRCRPEQVVEVLEAVNFLAGAGGCFIVLGIARPQVLDAVGLAYKNLAREMAAQGEIRGADGPASRRAYAELYLRKLINLEVPVPAFTTDAARGLIARSRKEQVAAPADWKQRVRPHAMRGILLASILGAGVAGVSLPDLMPVASEKTKTKAAVEASANVRTPSGPGGPAGESTAGRPETPRESTGPAVFEERKPAPIIGGWLAAGLLVPLAVVIGVSGVLLILTHRRVLTRVRDRDDFIDALDVWAEAAFAARATPREMKRFINRTRFAVTALDEYPDRDNAPLTDASIVKLAALAHYKRVIVEKWQRPVEDWDDWLKAGVLDNPPSGSSVDAPAEFRKALARHREIFPGTQIDRAGAEAFLELWGEVRFE